MSIFFIAKVTIKDQDKFQEYAQNAPATIVPYGGKSLVKGFKKQAIKGADEQHDVAAIFEFPDQQSFDTWYNSDAYQALIPLRDEGADISITLYDAMS